MCNAAPTMRESCVQGCFQVCLKDINVPEAQGFLMNGCAALKSAFACEELLLKPAGPGAPAGGVSILW